MYFFCSFELNKKIFKIYTYIQYIDINSPQFNLYQVKVIYKTVIYSYI